MGRKLIVITGLGASAGIATGKVRVIRGMQDLKAIQNGDILVASMTNVDFISAMRKAAAFVTDAGGTLCHAAIVAREFKVPCVVGTGNATSVLQTGMLVQVDGSAGTVTLL